MPKQTSKLLLAGLLILVACYSLALFRSQPAVDIWLVNAPLLGILVLTAIQNTEELIYKDSVTYATMAIGVGIHIAIGMGAILKGADGPVLFQRVGFSVGGLLLGAVIAWVLATVGSLAFKREFLGMGDIKFMGGTGAFVGPGILRVLLAWFCVWLLFTLAIWCAYGFLKKDYQSSVFPSSPIIVVASVLSLASQYEIMNVSLAAISMLFLLYAAFLFAGRQAGSRLEMLIPCHLFARR